MAAYDDIARYLFADASSAAFAAVTKGNSPIGYLWMATNCIATASYTLGMKRKIDTIGLKVRPPRVPSAMHASTRHRLTRQSDFCWCPGPRLVLLQ